jgi:hypothetical protein
VMDQVLEEINQLVVVVVLEPLVVMQLLEL